MRSIAGAPTLLALAGLPSPASFEGTPLLPMRPGALEDRLAVSAVGLNDYVPDLDYVAISSASHLYVRERRSGRAEFYDLVADPGAQIDLGGQAAGIEFYAAKVPAPLELPSAAAVLGDRAREQLEALGYLGSAGESTARRR